MTRTEAIEIAAQAWCQPRTSCKVFDPQLAEEFATLIMIQVHAAESKIYEEARDLAFERDLGEDS